jgi:excisionase family DNA binding protein
MRDYTTADAAKELGVTASRIRKMIDAGRLKGRKVGRDWLIKESDLEKARDRSPGRPREK